MLKSIVLSLAISLLSSVSAQAYSHSCGFAATLNTGLYVFKGEGSTPAAAHQNAINQCVQDGVISSFCIGGMISVGPSSKCQSANQPQYECTINTGLYVFAGKGQSPYLAHHDAINKCVQDGVIAGFCTGATVSCH